MKTKLLTLAFLLFIQSVFAQITGIWRGDLDIQGRKLPIIINVKSENNSYKSLAYSPKQSTKAIEVDETNYSSDDFSFKIEKLSAEYSGKLKGQEIVGKFSQNGTVFPLNLRKISEADFKKEMPSDLQPIGNREINFKKIDELLDYVAKNNQGIGSVSIFRHGKEVYRKDFGQNGISQKFNRNTGYQIGSISKMMTAVMLMQQVEKGKLNLSDKLFKFFPDAPNANKITIENLLSHKSGLGDYVGADYSWLFGKNVGNKVILDKIKKEGVEFQPGEKTRYSNSGYWLLSRILEKITKKSYNVLLKENILNKAGMTHTFSVLDRPKNIFGAYEYVGQKWIPKEDFDFQNAIGLGDITSTTEDLNLFANALFQGKLIKKETLQNMLPKNSQIGMGIFGIPFHNIKSYGHGGDTAGQHTALGYNMEDDYSFAMAINGERMPHNDLLIGILSIIYNQDYEFPKFEEFKEFAVSSGDLDKFSGEFTSSEIPLDIKIFKKENVLYAQATGQPSFPLTATAKNEFVFEQAGVKIIFAEDGKTMTMQQGGKDFYYKRK